MKGWRYFTLSPLTRQLVSPYRDSRGRLSYLWRTGEPMHATCTKSSHTAPAPGCTCGLRVLPDLPSLARYMLSEYRYRQATEKLCPTAVVWEQDYLDDVVLGQVSTTGRRMPGSQFDSADTERVEYATLTGPLWLSSRSHDLADQLADLYEVEVNVNAATPPQLLSELLRDSAACCACSSTEEVTDGLCADWAQCWPRMVTRLRAGEQL